MFTLLLSVKAPVFAAETTIEENVVEGLKTNKAAKKYTIKFDGNGATSGKMSSMKSCNYGKSYKLKANAFKCKGYTFAGWNTKADGSGKAYKNKASVKNLTSKITP